VPYFATDHGRAGIYRRERVYRVTSWTCELETIPEEWLELQPLIDEIRAPTEFIARAMRSRFTVPEAVGGREPEESAGAVSVC
jgi:hypothetical protein